MTITLHNMTDKVLKVKGSTVAFEITNAGQANVAIVLVLSDGTIFCYPQGTGKTQINSTSLPSGDYDCVLTFLAVGLNAFGKAYDSTITIAGKKAVTILGSITSASNVEQDFGIFKLRVS